MHCGMRLEMSLGHCEGKLSVYATNDELVGSKSDMLPQCGRISPLATVIEIWAGNKMEKAWTRRLRMYPVIGYRPIPISLRPCADNSAASTCGLGDTLWCPENATVFSLQLSEIKRVEPIIRWFGT